MLIKVLNVFHLKKGVNLTLLNIRQVKCVKYQPETGLNVINMLKHVKCVNHVKCVQPEEE